MEFRTMIHPREGEHFMRHSDKMMLMGSCFSDNIGARLKDAMVDVVATLATRALELAIADAAHESEGAYGLKSAHDLPGYDDSWVSDGRGVRTPSLDELYAQIRRR